MRCQLAWRSDRRCDSSHCAFGERKGAGGEGERFGTPAPGVSTVVGGVTGVLYYRQPPKEGCWINWIHEVIHLIQRCHCYVRKIVPCQPRAQLLPHSNGQALVRPSFYQPLVSVSVRRCSAARMRCD